MHISRALVSFVLLSVAVIVLAAGAGWRNVAALVLALLALVFALVLAGCALDCGVRSYEAKSTACSKDAGSWAQVQECQQLVECEFNTPACGVRLQ
jgi:cell division protein FtsW (lipid II flippase)